MSKESFNIIERHLEKGVLGLCAAFVLFMFYMYFINQPNRVEYNNEKLGASELAERVLADARRLESAMSSKRGEEPKIEKFSQRLRSQHDQGIFAAATGEKPAPPVPDTLARAASFGMKAEVAGMESVEEAPASITLVTPLPPDKPQVRTGRSLAIQTQVQPATSGAPQPAANAAAAAPEPAETAWVTVAAYFPKSAQYREMAQAGYAGWRQRVYVSGVDVERQELMPNGTDWTDWTPVNPQKSMPHVEVADPQFDDRGELLNKPELDQSFQLVKQEQNLIMQAPFFTVTEGDPWEIPPIAGFEEEVDEDGEIPQYVELPKKESGSSGGSPVRIASGGGSPLGGRLGGGSRGGGGRGGVVGGGREGGGAMRMPMGGGGESTADRRKEARRQVQQLFTEADQALRDKNYNLAIERATQTVNIEFANKGDERRANLLIHRAKKRQEREMKMAGIQPPTNTPTISNAPQLPPGMPPEFGGRFGGREGAPPLELSGGGRTMGRMAPTPMMNYSSPQAPTQLVRNSETNDPAVWFHDDTVAEGKTYRYRMRVVLWNRYVGQMRAMKDPTQARTAVVPGEWSEPSDPITVTPTTYFFVKGGRANTQLAGIEVWKWREGRWLHERFDVGIGDAIGSVEKVKVDDDLEGKPVREDVDFSTNAVVLDVRPDEKVKVRVRGKDGTFTMNEKTTTVVVYRDPLDGQVKEKSQLADAYDPILKRLEEEEG